MLARVSTHDLYEQSRLSREEARQLKNPKQRALLLRQADEILVAVAGRAPETPETLALKAKADAERAAFVAAAQTRDTAAVQQHYLAYQGALDQLATYALRAAERAVKKAERDHAKTAAK